MEVRPLLDIEFLVRKFDGEMHETQADATRTALEESLGKELQCFTNDDSTNSQGETTSFVSQETLRNKSHFEN